MNVADSGFIKACYGRNKGTIPVWVMRQAGRYLPDYRAVREKVSFLELCRTPELIAEVVRQPVEKFGLDAAILFSDILILLEPMGVPVSFPEGGPRVESPIRTVDDVEGLIDFDVARALPFVADGVREIKKIIPAVPLIGFAGSPFTLACYLIEGKGSNHFNKPKQFIHEHPEAADRMMSLVASITTRYLEMQIKAGADAVQLFDSWGGILSQDDYRDWSLKYIERIFAGLKKYAVPRILFVNNVAPYVDLIKNLDCEVVGVDYRADLAEMAKALPDKAVQGNLDPAVLFGPLEGVRAKTRAILDSLDNHDRLIFNLGHGILPSTPVEAVRVLVETVHSYR